MTSTTSCFLCPGGAAPFYPSSMVTIPDTNDTYSCATIAGVVSSIGNTGDDKLTCLAIQLIAGDICCEQSWSSMCDAFNDPCPLAGSGLCKDVEVNPTFDPSGLCLDILADCLDCDPCSEYHFTSCGECTSAGSNARTCYWCPGDGRCFSKPYLTYPSYPTGFNIQENACSSSESDWQTTCDATESTAIYNDPMYSADAWAYRLINVESVWEQGITGQGVRIRINDIGIDAAHPEFAGKIDLEGSCDLYLNGDLTESHGTACASIAAALGNNSECAVGIAPGATISSCKMMGIGVEFEGDPTVLVEKLQSQDVSSNSFGTIGCQSIFTDDAGVVGDDTISGRRRNSLSRLLQQVGSCPFVSGSGAPPCSVCDFTVEPLDVTCTSAIAEYCSNPRVYESDSTCMLYLEHFTTCRFNGLSAEYQFSLTKGVTEGRNGLGLIFVFASGNENDAGSDANFEGLGSTRFTISVGAVGKDGIHSTYSTPGSCLFVSAPGGDFESSSNWITAAPGGTCGDATIGTSFATPAVAGVIALMLEVNPNLGWRDVQGIIAKTSQVTDANDESWVTNAAGFSQSYKYGFGIIDAAAAVAEASTWVNFAPENMLSASSGTVNIPIDDSAGTASTSALTINGIMTVESVVVYLDLESSSRGNLEILLVSPSGTESILTPGMRPENEQWPDAKRWKLMTVRSWGESSEGQWMISIKDTEPGDVSTCVDLPFEDVDLEDLDCKLLQENLAELGTTEEEVCADSRISTSCCFCGGGQAASSIQDQLTSWTLVIYGRDLAGNLEPTVSPAPTVSELVPCMQEEFDLSSCLGGVDGGSSCLDCVVGFYSLQLLDCTDVDDETCTALENCSSCGSCGSSYISWLNCRVECSVTCPSIVPSCEQEKEDFNSCLSTVEGGDMCPGCIEDFYPSSPELCSDIDVEACTGIASCPCGGCGNTYLTLFNCLSGCSVECDAGGVVPTPLPVSVPTAPSAVDTPTIKPVQPPIPSNVNVPSASVPTAPSTPTTKPAQPPTTSNATAPSTSGGAPPALYYAGFLFAFFVHLFVLYYQ